MSRSVLGSFAVALLFSAMVLPATEVSAQAPAAAGIWLDDESRAGIEIKACGDQLCGNIVWLRDPLNPEGKPWTDKLNPEESKRTRPVCGLQIMGNLKKGANGAWTDGWIYDPAEGKQFDLEVSMKGNDTLVVRGFWKVRMLGETYEWRRMPANTPRCKA